MHWDQARHVQQMRNTLTMQRGRHIETRIDIDALRQRQQHMTKGKGCQKNCSRPHTKDWLKLSRIHRRVLKESGAEISLLYLTRTTETEEGENDAHVMYMCRKSDSASVSASKCALRKVYQHRKESHSDRWFQY